MCKKLTELVERVTKYDYISTIKDFWQPIKKYTWDKVKAYPIWAILIISAFVPLIFYFKKFHGALSSDLAVWSTFGTYIGGVYGPIFTLASVLVLVKTLLEISNFNQKSLEQSQKSNSLAQTIKLIEIMDLAITKTSIIGENREQNFKWLGDAVKERFKVNDPANETEVRDASVARFKDTDAGSLDDAMSILKEILTRINIAEDEELKASSMAAFRAMIPNNERYWLECFAERFHPDIKLLIKLWPSPFSILPPDLNRLIMQPEDVS